MHILLLNAWALCVVLVGRFVHFNDADRALADGVFSATSTTHYSITRITFLFVCYIAGGVILAWWRFREHKRVAIDEPTRDFLEADIAVTSSPMLMWEKIVVVSVVIAAFVVPFVTRDRLFGSHTLLNEDFFNFAAATTIREPLPASGFPTYPYAFGPLVLFNWCGGWPSAAVLVVALLSVLALLGIYWYLRSTVINARYRAWYYFIFLAIFHYVIIFPTFHRNLFRFATPLFVAFALSRLYQSFVTNTRKAWWSAALWCGIWFFSSADTLIVAGVIYSVFACSVLWHSQRLRTIGLLVGAPTVAWCAHLVFFGSVYVSFFRAQLLSLFAYSSHFNAVPYFLIPTELHGFGEVAKLVVTFLIMFLPWVLIFNAAIFVTKYFSKTSLAFNSRYVFLATLLLAYTIGYRQNFGDAGFSRIAITSFILIAILPIFDRLRRVHLAQALSVGYYFLFGLLFLVSLYFGRYSFVDIWRAHQALSRRTDTIACSTTPFAKVFAAAGYTRCEDETVRELEVLKNKIDKSTFFVYDDTPGLYYALGSPAVAIAPSLSMGATSQITLLHAITQDAVQYIIQRKQVHFFGVPPGSESDERFMKLIQSEMQKNWQIVLDTNNFILWKRK